MIDAHHHFLDPARRTYPWLGPALAALRRRFGPEDLRPLLQAAGVERTIVVQTVSSLDETVELLATAAATDFVAGVVGWVDLRDPGVGATLVGLRRAPGGEYLVGIRHQVHDETDPDWLLDGDVQQGLAAAGEAGLVYDLLVRTRELPAALVTVRRHPGLRFVVDHLAKPRIAAGPRDPEWEAALAPLAEQPNVCCKLSGMVTEADWRSWRAADIEPYLERAVGWFGADRCLFGSDWPVCTLAAGYGAVVELVRGLGAGVMGVNAASVYRLPLS